MSDGELWDELKGVIEQAILNHPRSNQKELGPSDLGTPCMRKLGFKLAGIEPCNTRGAVPWRPTVGVAVHVWTAEAFAALSEAGIDAGYEVEKNFPVGTLGSLGTIYGTTDLLMARRKTVVDWKVVGTTTLRDVARRIKNGDVGPEPGYRNQIHTYARGAVHAGYEIDTVAIVFLPSAGELGDAICWSEPYDPERAAAVFHTARELLTLIESDPSTLAKLKRADDHCGHCPFFVPGTEKLDTQCPGAPSMQAKIGPPPSVQSLLA